MFTTIITTILIVLGVIVVAAVVVFVVIPVLIFMGIAHAITSAPAPVIVEPAPYVWQMPADQMPVCAADKVSTINEIAGQGPQRIEVSTGDIMHFEYYPKHGVKSVSILVHANDPYTVLGGYGSMWQWALRDCAGYDFIADLTAYAGGRDNVGHSGLVYASLQDYLDGKAPVANIHGVDPKQYRPVYWTK